MSWPGTDSNPSDQEERLGEAIEIYLALAESGDAPDPETYAARHPELQEDLQDALEGLALVRVLVGDSRGEPGALQAGQRVAGYRIVRELGRGGMGIVYEAVHVDLDRPVALKVLGHEAAPDSSGRKRFLNEAKTAASLHHTHIVPVFDVGQVGGLCYYAMQRIEGSGLDRVIRLLKQNRNPGSRPDFTEPATAMRTSRSSASSRPFSAGSGAKITTNQKSDLSGVPSALSPNVSGLRRRSGWSPATDEDIESPYDPPTGSAYYHWIATLIRQAADALAYAHQQGIIHRDIKPSNVLVDTRGNGWIADFGLARRATDPGLSQLATGPVGTPRYMSPEQATGTPVDPRSDIYSLGSTLYELLTLRPPFDGKTSAEVIGQIRNNDPLLPRQIAPRTPRDLETIALKAMAKRPEDRYVSAEALADDLGRFLTLEPIRARRISPIGRLIRFARRHPFSSSISAVAATTVLAVATWAHLSVVTERNNAIAAAKNTQIAMDQTKEAISRSESARAQQLWRESTVIRLSALPERRNQGLNRLRESANLSSDPDLRVKLREEAVAFLALQDLEPRPPLPTGPTTGTAFINSVNDPTLACLSEDGEWVSLYRLADGTLLRRIELGWGYAETVRDNMSLRISPRGGPRQGSRIAAGGSLLFVVWPNGRGIRLLDGLTGLTQSDLSMTGRQIEGISTTPDGHRLITLERFGNPGNPAGGRPTPGRLPIPLKAILWDITQSPVALATLADPSALDPSPQPGRFPEIPLLASDPEGQTIAQTWIQFQVPDSGSTIVLIDTNTGQESSKVPGVPGTITALTQGPEQLLAAALNDGSIRIWEGSAHTSLPGLYHHQATVGKLCFSPDGRLLALAGLANGIEVWNVGTNTLVASLQAPEPAIDLKFSPTGHTLLASTRTSIARWEIVEPVGRSVLSGFDGRITSMTFDNHGTLAVADWTGQTRLWSTEEGRGTGRSLGKLNRMALLIYDELGTLNAVDSEGIDRNPFLTSRQQKFLPFEDIQPFDGPRYEPVSPPNIASMIQTPGVIGGSALIVQGTMLEALRRTQTRRIPGWVMLSQSADRQQIAIARGEQIFLWRKSSPETVVRVQLTRPDSPHTEYGPGNRLRMRERSERNEREPRTGPRGPGGWNALTLDPKGQAIYLLDNGGRLQAWILDEKQTGKTVATELPWKIDQVFSSLCLSPSGRILACGTDQGSIRLIDTSNGQELSSFNDSNGEDQARITALAFAPNERMLAIGDRRGNLELWSIPSLPTTSPAIKPSRLVKLCQHVGAVGPLIFDEHGRYLASAGDDKIVQIWELEQIRISLENLSLGWALPAGM